MEGLVHLDFLSLETQAEVIRSGVLVEVFYLDWEKSPDLIIETHFRGAVPKDLVDHVIVDQFVWTLPIEHGTLDKWWRHYQTIEPLDRPEALKIRSMSVGDAFLINGRPHFCMSPTGWSE